MEEITHEATCSACGQQLVGGKRQQEAWSRVFWVHADRSDELKGGLHTAVPVAGSEVKIAG